MYWLREKEKLFEKKILDESNGNFFIEKNLKEKILSIIDEETYLEIEKIEKFLFENRYNKNINLEKIINVHILPKFPLIQEYKSYSKKELFHLKNMSPSFFEKLGVEYLKYKKMSKNLQNYINTKHFMTDKVIINYYIDFEENIDFFIFKNSNKGYTIETLKEMHLKRKQDILEINSLIKEREYQCKQISDEVERKRKISEENRVQRLREKFIKLDNIFSGRIFGLTDEKDRKEFEEIRTELSSMGRLPY
ncbi:hypothetical protein [Aliarcobacter butzleri]|uniref:hypothetical protein n=1 Tax=Aliarcobacter butzleri TaxID=28197 RepID=UPI00062E6424|nr:hypothetical protein [Aliarcobacter butzleri]KLD98298.1 hypothetical protein AF74_03525 [Aliarcobacter butzleri L349]